MFDLHDLARAGNISKSQARKLPTKDSSDAQPLVIGGRTIERAPDSAPKPRFKANDIAILRITVGDGLMTSIFPAFNPGTYYANALIVPNESAPAMNGSSSGLVVVKVVS